MHFERQPSLTELNAQHLREYILDLVQELAAVAARKGDLGSAQALHTCWSRIREEEDLTA